jgi:hypothetical protein
MRPRPATGGVVDARDPVPPGAVSPVHGGVPRGTQPDAGSRNAGTVLFGGAASPSPGHRTGGVSLPPEGPSSSAPPLPGLNLPGFDGQGGTRADAAELAVRRHYERRNRLALAIVLTVVVVGAAGAVFWVVLPSFQSAPAAAVVEEEAASAQLRKDDPTSRGRAVARLKALVAAQPRYVEAHATLALALLLDLDDRRAAIQRFTREAEALTTQKARLEAERPTTDWRVQANRLVDQIAGLKTKSDPLFEEAKGLQTQANAAYAALMKLQAVQPGELLARTRTEALFNAIDGRDQAIALAERYRQLGGQDGWADVANAEYALNTRVTPETSAQALEAMRALQKRDTTFLRPYVLGGRLALQTKQRDLAASQFDAALALNPDLVLAQMLGEDARAPERH